MQLKEPAIGYVLLAAVAGALGYIVRQQNAKEAIVWTEVLVRGASAGFVGLLVYWLCAYMKLDSNITGITVGVFGWIGATATMEVLRKIVFNRIGEK